MTIELPKPIAVTPVPNVRYREFTKCGQKPLAGGQIWTYEANSTTPKITYQDPYGMTPNTNPIILDAAGEADVYLNGTYRFVVKDKNGVIQKDVSKIGSWYSGDLDDQMKSVNDLLESSAQTLMQPLREAIDAAAAAGAGENGWTTLLVQDPSSGQSQDFINNIQLLGVISLADLRSTKPFYAGHKVGLISVNRNQNEGGGEFIATRKSGLVDNGGTIISSADPNLFWVRINYEFLTPEMCGSVNNHDSTDAIERFFNICGTGIKGQSSGEKQYLINKPLTCYFDSNVNINLNNCVIKPNFTVDQGTVVQTILLTTKDDLYKGGLTLNILNSKFDLSLINFSVSTSVLDRRGIRGLVLRNAGTINIDGYFCKNSFYGSGLKLTEYNTASIKNIDLQDVGAKINPDKDDTGVYDAAGDAIYLGNIRGIGVTSIENANCRSYENYIGRAGVVLEQFGGVTQQHIVNMRNCNFEGYHRNIHQEDGGAGVVIWSGGSTKKFSNLLFNLGGKPDQIYLSLSDINIEVNPPFGYGGTSGIVNFQGAGDCLINGCNIDYLSNVTERGNKFTYNSNINVKALVDHGVSTKSHVLSGNTINIYSNYLFYTATNKGVSSISNTYNNLTVSNNIADAIRSTSNLINSLKDTFNNVSLFCENTLPLGIGKNKINGSTFNYTRNVNSVLFFSSFQTGYELNNCTIRSLNATLGLRGDGLVGYKIYNSDLYNVKILTSNISFNQNHVLDLTNSNLTYDDKYNDSTPILPFGQLVGMVKGNNFYNNTAIDINLPAESATFLYKNRGNVIIKSGSITAL